MGRPLTAAGFDRLLKPLLPADTLALAVSGGGDSVALMLLAARWRDWLAAKGRPSPKLQVLTVDHGLRPEAADEARQVARWARALDLPHRTLRWEGDKPTGDVQAAARTARYALLTGWCRARKGGRADLLVAHHLDDQAETFLMRLQRGSGVDGLAAMSAVSQRAGIRVLRPFLEVPKDRLLATLERAGQDWIHDPSNEDDRFLRVRTRSALVALAELGITRERLVTTARHMARAREALEAATDRLTDEAVETDAFGAVRLDAARLGEAPEEVQLRLLARLFQCTGGMAYKPRLSSLEPVLDAILTGKLARGRTLGGVKVSATRRGVLFQRELAAAEKATLTLRSGTQACWDGRFDVALGRGRKGEVFTVRALGLQGVKMLRDAGHGLPKHIPSQVLAALPALWVKGRLLAQPQLSFKAPKSPVFRVLPVKPV